MGLLPTISRRAGRGGRRTAAAVLALALLAAPVQAQDSGVSGIPPGPANQNGLNGSIADPSGIGNAARMPPLPRPDPVPVTPSYPSGPPGSLSSPQLRYVRPYVPERLSKRDRQRLERARVRENDRLLRRGAVSICRGC
ncbi:hypothetical protein LQG66_13240 [Bradyrhizobium ontarionense]|uniref:Uncharacterized protein n=1 Tax=Bradyrhizobium ontarionense TaxID=2898149 RepID=A0ABY3RIX4_9BRAD|nr:hypothetical protein [Bradyrhizobium sp. A19]UFZ07204.1 hypothetical protein LQG66_13240 [Bradyrhizobium sp. A19]